MESLDLVRIFELEAYHHAVPDGRRFPVGGRQYAELPPASTGIYAPTILTVMDGPSARDREKRAVK
jgi:hypothetical protein